MRKLYLALIVIIVILSGLIYFSVSGIQTVSTDKKIYSLGEEVKIHWSEFSLKWCSCSNREIVIFKQETTGWERVSYRLFRIVVFACVNGRVEGFGMPCDVVSCSFPKPNFESGDFSWNSKIFERNGTVNSCLKPFNNEVINRTMQSYELKNATSGKYKIQFGSSNRIIEIQ